MNSFNKLIKYIKVRLGDISLNEAINIGIENTSGYRFKDQTFSFFKKFKKEIINALEEFSINSNEDIIDILSSIYKLKKFSKSDISKVLYGNEFNKDIIHEIVIFTVETTIINILNKGE